MLKTLLGFSNEMASVGLSRRSFTFFALCILYRCFSEMVSGTCFLVFVVFIITDVFS